LRLNISFTSRVRKLCLAIWKPLTGPTTSVRYFITQNPKAEKLHLWKKGRGVL